jgi:ribosomal protein S18 acetylase RimI-like enzyme
MPVMLSQALLGRRVVLRYRRPEAGAVPPLTDAVGELSELSGTTATVQTRGGPVRVPLPAIVLARPVAASRREILELERISRRGWRAGHTAELDGWLLFADRGWTGRANSVLPLVTPARPLSDLLDRAREFFAGHGLGLQIQIPLPARGLLDAELAARCWTLQRPSVVLASTGLQLPPPATGDRPELRLATAPDEQWLQAYHYRGAPLPDFARELLTRHDLVCFLTLLQDGQAVAIGRATVDEGWLGITAVEVAPEHRRRGLARLVMSELTRWGIERGARRCYLQVDEANHPALALYASLGFIEHHRYHYRVEPGGR